MTDDRRLRADDDRTGSSPSSVVRRASSAPMRILVTNDDGIHSEGLDVCAEIGRALSRGRLGGGARIRPVRRVALALAQRSAAAARGRRAPLRGQRHAHRLRHHGLAPRHQGPPARSGALRRQPRPQCRRGRDLFRHRRRRGGGNHSRDSVAGAVAGLQVPQRPAAALGNGGPLRARDHPPRARGRHTRATCSSMSIFRIARPARSRASR